MKYLDQLCEAARVWDAFLVAYVDVDPGVAFDLRGDPPQFVRYLNREILRTCDENGIEVDNLPSDVAL